MNAPLTPEFPTWNHYFSVMHALQVIFFVGVQQLITTMRGNVLLWHAGYWVYTSVMIDSNGHTLFHPGPCYWVTLSVCACDINLQLLNWVSLKEIVRLDLLNNQLICFPHKRNMHYKMALEHWAFIWLGFFANILLFHAPIGLKWIRLHSIKACYDF